MITCGTGDQLVPATLNERIAPLGNSYFSNMAFGETPVTGSWRGAATNGGTSLVITKMSYDMWLPFASEWWGLFGGLQLFAGTAIGWGDDDTDSTQFGTQVAYQYSVNPSGSVASGFLDAISSITDGDGSCPSAYGGFSHAGGINGCGCHAIMATSNTNPCAIARINDRWGALLNDESGCQTGSIVNGGYWYWLINCNYNPTNSWIGGP
jgi:hypothetical protein